MHFLGAQLHAYDLNLTAYAISNVIQFLPDQRFAQWVNKQIKSPTAIEYLRKWGDEKYDASQVRELLSDADMYAIETVFEDEQPRGSWDWEPYHALHLLYLRTVREVREGLSLQVADDWSAECVQFGSKLDTEGLKLYEGFGIVRAWVQRLRELQLALGAEQFVPPADIPKWHVSTLTPATGTTEDAHAKRLILVERMRMAVAKLGKDATPNGLIKEAKIKNKNGRDVLRELEKLGEYNGFTRERKYMPEHQ